MPTYVYGCDACGHRFEKFQKFADEPIRVCPECQSSVRRIFQPAGIVFKGSGWHITDYKRNGSKGTDSSSDGESKSNGESTAKQETKAADASSESTTSATKGDAGKSTASDAPSPAKTPS